MQREPPMKTLVSIITPGLAVALAVWDATAKKCK